MNFSQSLTFAKSDAYSKTFWNPCFRSQNGDFYKKLVPETTFINCKNTRSYISQKCLIWLLTSYNRPCCSCALLDKCFTITKTSTFLSCLLQLCLSRKECLCDPCLNLVVRTNQNETKTYFFLSLSLFSFADKFASFCTSFWPDIKHKEC